MAAKPEGPERRAHKRRADGRTLGWGTLKGRLSRVQGRQDQTRKSQGNDLNMSRNRTVEQTSNVNLDLEVNAVNEHY